MNSTQTPVHVLRGVQSLRARVSVVVSPSDTQTKRIPSRSRMRGQASVVLFLAIMVFANGALAIGMDDWFPTLRDPEYGRRLARLQALQAEHPHRPVVLFMGSSRAAMGIRPDCMHDSPECPLYVNFSTIGSGPIMQLMMLRRLLEDGKRPSAIVLEYWPAFLREDGSYAEQARIDPHRLLWRDRPLIREYFTNPDHTEAIMAEVRHVPLSSHRLRLLSQITPSWLPHHRRQDGPWDKMDRWGWLPGFEGGASVELHAARHDHAAEFYRPLFEGYQVSPLAERALKDIALSCQEHGIKLSLLWLPESTKFRTFYTPEAEAAGQEFLAKFAAEHNLRVIHARDWVPDEHLADGFHLTQHGAEIFSRKLANSLAHPVPQQEVTP